uniref:Os10g0478300 protein, related n=1 Tax=Neospora caninum (strain Liverpool) TaxID=572307 RepID=A0A0F7UIU6_NEOCL|nr:TPA: Os10g0478300 protein, related [Neospora caninum Liverpool]
MNGTWQNSEIVGEHKGTASVVETNLFSTGVHAGESLCFTRWSSVKEGNWDDELSTTSNIAGVLPLFANPEESVSPHRDDETARQDEEGEGQEQPQLDSSVGEQQRKGNMAGRGDTSMVIKSEVEECEGYSVERKQQSEGDRTTPDGLCKLVDGKRVNRTDGVQEGENGNTLMAQQQSEQMPVAQYRGDNCFHSSSHLGDFQSSPSGASPGHQVTRKPGLLLRDSYSACTEHCLEWRCAEMPVHVDTAENAPVIHNGSCGETISEGGVTLSQGPEQSNHHFDVGAQVGTEHPEFFSGTGETGMEQCNERRAEMLQWRHREGARSPSETECVTDEPKGTPGQENRTTVRPGQNPATARRGARNATASSLGLDSTTAIARELHSWNQRPDTVTPGWAWHHFSPPELPSLRPQLREETRGCRDGEIVSWGQPADCGGTETQNAQASPSLAIDPKTKSDAIEASFTDTNDIHTTRPCDEVSLEMQLYLPHLRCSTEYEGGKSQRTPTAQESKAKLLSTGPSLSFYNTAIHRAGLPLSIPTTVPVHHGDVEDPASKRIPLFGGSVSGGHCVPRSSNTGAVMEPCVPVVELSSPRSCVEERETSRHGDAAGRDTLERRALPFSPAAPMTGCSSTAASSVVSGDVFASVATPARANVYGNSTETQEEGGCGEAPRYVLLFPDEEEERLGPARTIATTHCGAGQTKYMVKSEGFGVPTIREVTKIPEIRTPTRIHPRRLLPGATLQGMACDGCGTSNPPTVITASETGFLPEMCFLSPQRQPQLASVGNQDYSAGFDSGTPRIAQIREIDSWADSLTEGEKKLTTSSPSYGQEAHKRCSFFQSINNRIVGVKADPTSTCGYHSPKETLNSGCAAREQMVGGKPPLAQSSLTREGKHRGQQTQLRKSGVPAWSAEEDARLAELVARKGFKWALISSQLTGAFGIPRTGKQCRERWFNHVNPEVKKGDWSAEEDAMILTLQNELGNRWATIAKRLRGRTENAVKNRFISLSNARLGYGRPKRDGSSADCFGSGRNCNARSPSGPMMPHLCQATCSASTTTNDSVSSGNHPVISAGRELFESPEVAVDSPVSGQRQCSGTLPSYVHPTGASSSRMHPRTAGEGHSTHSRNSDAGNLEQPAHQECNESGRGDAEQNMFAGMKPGTRSVSQDAVPVGRLIIAGLDPPVLVRTFPVAETSPKTLSKEHGSERLNNERDCLKLSNSASEESFLASTSENPVGIKVNDADGNTHEPQQKRRRKRSALVYQGGERDSNGPDLNVDRHVENAGSLRTLGTADRDTPPANYVEPHRFEEFSPYELVFQPALRPTCDQQGWTPPNAVEASEQASHDAQGQWRCDGHRTGYRTAQGSVYSSEVESGDLRSVCRLTEQQSSFQGAERAWSEAGLQLFVAHKRGKIYPTTELDSPSTFFQCSPSSLPTFPQQAVFQYDRFRNKVPSGNTSAGASGAQRTFEESGGLFKEGPSVTTPGRNMELVQRLSVPLRRCEASSNAHFWTSPEIQFGRNSLHQRLDSCHQYCKQHAPCCGRTEQFYKLTSSHQENGSGKDACRVSVSPTGKIDDLQKQSRGTLLSAKEDIGEPGTWPHAANIISSNSDHQNAWLCAENSSGCDDGRRGPVGFGEICVKSGINMNTTCGSGNPSGNKDGRSRETWRCEQRDDDQVQSFESRCRVASSVGGAEEPANIESKLMLLRATTTARLPAGSDKLFSNDARCSVVAQLDPQINNENSQETRYAEVFLERGGERMVNVSSGPEPNEGCGYNIEQTGACTTGFHRPMHSCSTIDSEEFEDFSSSQKASGDRGHISRRKGDVLPLTEWAKYDGLRELYWNGAAAFPRDPPSDWKGSWSNSVGCEHQNSLCSPDGVSASDFSEMNRWRLYGAAAVEVGTSHISSSTSHSLASQTVDKIRVPPKTGMTSCDVPESLGVNENAASPVGNPHVRGNCNGPGTCRTGEPDQSAWVGVQQNQRPSETSIFAGTRNNDTRGRQKSRIVPGEEDSVVRTRRKDSGSTAATVSRAASVSLAAPGPACDSSSSQPDASSRGHHLSFSFSHCSEATLNRSASSSYSCPPPTCHMSDERPLEPSEEGGALRSLNLAPVYGHLGLPAEGATAGHGRALEHPLIESQMEPSDGEVRLWGHPHETNWPQGTLEPVGFACGMDGGVLECKETEESTPGNRRIHRDDHDRRHMQHQDGERICPSPPIEAILPHLRAREEMPAQPLEAQGTPPLRRDLASHVQQETNQGIAGNGCGPESTEATGFESLGPPLQLLLVDGYTPFEPTEDKDTQTVERTLFSVPAQERDIRDEDEEDNCSACRTGSRF